VAFFVSDGAGAGLLPERARAAVSRRIGEVWGLGFLGAGLLIGAALASHAPGDPSHFSATGAAPANWLGRPGAVLSDPVIRVLGVAGWFLALFPIVWGVRFLLHRGEQRIWARLLLVPPAIAAGAVLAAAHAVPDVSARAIGFGGVLGDGVAEALLGAIPGAPGDVLTWLALSLVLPTILLWAAAFGVTTTEAKAGARWLLGSLGHVARSLVALAATAGARTAARAASAARARHVHVDVPAEAAERRASGAGNADSAAPELSRPSAPSAAGEAERWGPPTLSRFERMFRDPPERPEARREPIIAPGTAPEFEVEDSASRPLAEAIAALKSGVPEAPEIALPTEDEGDDFDGLLGLDREAAMQRYTPGPEAPRTTVSHPPKPARKSRRAEREAQPSLALDGLDPEGSDAFETPPLALLQAPTADLRAPISEHALEENARMLETVLDDYGVRGEIVAVKAGPVVTLYELEPAPGLKASRVIGLADDIARSMSALSARVSTVPGRTVIGIELPNDRRETVLLRELLESADYGDSRHPLALALGKDIEGTPVVVNLAKMPHLLIAGTTGSGKSVAINTMILSLLYRLSPDQCRLIMIDPKMLELSVYDDIPHLLTPVVTDPKKALVALKWVVAEMEERYRKMSRLGVRNIDGYNARVDAALAKGEGFERTVQTGFDDATGEPIYETETFEPERMPLIVVIVDEMADLMMVAGKEIEACIQRLAQMARASGIHLIMATQRPSVDVITGTIKANFPTRISFQVTSKIDSRTILGEQGAEQLLGAGDMLYMAPGGRVRRLHGPFVSDQEVEEVVRHLKSLGPPDYMHDVTAGGDDDGPATVEEKLGLGSPGDSEDALYDHAVAIVARDRKCSTSYIQRKLQIGYNKAARLVEQMEDEGVVSPANQVGKREILIEER